MSLLDRIAACRTWQPENYRPFIVGSAQVGRIRHETAKRLAPYDRAFEVADKGVRLHPRLEGFEDRTAAVAEVLNEIREYGEIPQWRNEPYPVLTRWGTPPLLNIERAAVPLFGVRGYGVHLNGYRDKEGRPHLWVGKRSMTKPTGPGKLDHIVAGGQPTGIGVRENLIKECAEEADMPGALAEQAVSVGAITYITERPEGLRDDVLFCFDLRVPEDFEPRNTDGEVEAFYLWPMEQVLETLAETDDFKFNVALVKIDFLIRHGYLTAADPDYLDLVAGMQRSG